MKTNYKSLMLLAAATLGLGFFSACEDDSEETMSRLFRPVVSEDKIVLGLDANEIPYATINWDAYENAEKYELIVTATDGSAEYTVVSDSSAHTFNNLAYDLEYNLKIKAINEKSGLESKYYETSFVTLDFPTMLMNISSSDIIDTEFRAKWDVNEGETVYDSLKVYHVNKDSLVAAVEVTEDALAAGELIIGGLSPKTDYRLEAWLGDVYKGKKLFKTVESESHEGYVIDLRVEDDGKSISTLVANALTEHPDTNITIVFKGGVTYKMSGIKLNTSTTGTLKFVTGLSLEGLAELAVEGNFDSGADVNFGGIHFDKIFFTEGVSGKKKTEQYYGGTYLFNWSAAGARIENISITNCTIKYKRGIMRIKAGTTVGSFVMDNCVVDSISGFGITNHDNGEAVTNNITVTNSTFSNCAKLFVGAKGADAIESINIENCTFVYCLTSGGALFDYKDKNIPTFNVKNCLFGKSGETPVYADMSAFVKGYNGPQPNCEGCYATSDYLWCTTEGATPSNELTLDGTLGATTDELFVAPKESDFTFTSHEDAKTAKRAGDPRWK